VSIRSTQRRHRGAMKRLMIDRCQIRRAAAGDERGPWNPDASDYDPAPPTVIVDDAACLVSTPESSERLVEVAGSPVTLRTLNVDLDPDVSETIHVGDEFTLTRTLNPRLRDRLWHVIDVTDGTLSAARRLTVREELPR
jgi:hypothetical protein